MEELHGYPYDDTMDQAKREVFDKEIYHLGSRT